MAAWRRPWWALGAVALASVARTAVAAVCEGTGEQAPDVVTLMASTKNPTWEGWVVSPDCTVKTIRVDRNSESSFIANSLAIQRVASMPTGTLSVELLENPLSRGADLSMTGSIDASLSSVPTDPRSLLLPSTLQTIRFSSDTNGELASLDGIQLPTNLVSLEIYKTSIKSLKNVQIPDSVTYMSISETPLTDIDLTLPANLYSLIIRDLPSKSRTLEQIVIPSKLDSIYVIQSGSVSIRGIKWPASLQTFDFSGTKITDFEICESDVQTFKQLREFTAPVTATTCSGSGKLQVVGTGRACVISDTEFERLYGTIVSPTPANPATAPSPSKTKASSSASKTSKGGSDDGSTGGSTKGSTSNANDNSASSLLGDGSALGGGSSVKKKSLSSAGSSFDLSTDTGSSEIGTDDGSQTTSSNSSSSPQASSSRSPNASATSSSSGSSGVIIAIVLISVVVAVAACGMAVKSKKRHTARGDDTYDGTIGKHEGTDTVTASFNDYATSTTQMRFPIASELEAMAFDFRNDSDLVRSRINQVTVGRQIARGGYGIVYRGSYQGRVVAIKQMLPDAWRNDSMVADFADEIRMCARLKHEKIVEFIGVSWTGVRDLSVVTEFMAGGDLHSVIRKYPESSGREWTRPWTSSNLRNKTLIAIDVAEAVVYLHSLSPAVIHRDLKSKNVLLDLVGNAKLSDFGISRTVTVDETMTSEVGTAAWIAPEVLRGERYSEKADIYSLGVLLVELDRCSHPYANEPVLLMGSLTPARGALSRANTSHVAHKNTQIAVFVSTGQLRPSTSQGCPEPVATLIRRCLSFDAGDRPTPIEVVQQLRAIQRTQEEAGDTK